MVRAMKRLAAAVVLAACTEHGMTPTDDGNTTPTVDPPPMMVGCANGHRDKIKFDQNTSCANDGGVEFCIPDNDASIQTTLAAISSSIRCAPGGGRAGCSSSPGLLLCSYPTGFPVQCVAPQGEMTADTWSDMCAIAGLDQIVQIVPTILE
jgi:hypothetical protein